MIFSKSFLALTVTLSASLAASIELDAKLLFHEWKDTHAKTYASVDEAEQRFQTWMANDGT